MLKKTLLCALAACLLCLPFLACGAEGLRPNTFFAADMQGGQEDSILSTASDGRSFFMLSALRMYGYTPGSDEKQTLLDWDAIFAGMNQGQSREALLRDFAKTRIDCLISGEGTLYTLNEGTGEISLWTGEALAPYAKLNVEASGIRHSTSDKYIRGRHLYYVTAGEVDEEGADLCDYDMDADTIKRVRVGNALQLVRFGEDDLALLVALDEETEGYEVTAYHIESGELQPIAAFHNRKIGGLGYSDEKQCLLYMEEGTVFSLNAQGESQVAGRFPVGASEPEWRLYAYADDSCVLVTSKGIYVRTMKGDGNLPHTLTLYLTNADAAPSFAAAYPNYDICVRQAEQGQPDLLARELIDGSLNADVLEIDASTLLPVLMEKGYAADLSSYASLTDEAKAMYSAIQAAIMRDGKLYAIPSQMTVHSWMYDDRTWREHMEAKAPETVDAYIALCEQWLERCESEEEDFSLLYSGQDFFFQLITDVFSLYVDQYDSEEHQLTFNSDVFRNALDKVTALQSAYDMSDGWSNPSGQRPALNTDNTVCFGEDRYGRLAIPPVFEKDRAPVVDAQLTVYVINANSENQEAAVRFLEHISQNRSPSDERMMKPNVNAPVEHPNFAQEQAALADNIAYLYEAKENAEGDALRQMQTTIDLQESILATAEERRWYISEQDITDYRNVAQYLNIRQTVFSRIQAEASISLFYDILSQYYYGEIDLDTCIEKLEAKLQMIQMESSM